MWSPSVTIVFRCCRQAQILPCSARQHRLPTQITQYTTQPCSSMKLARHCIVIKSVTSPSIRLVGLVMTPTAVPQIPDGRRPAVPELPRAASKRCAWRSLCCAVREMMIVTLAACYHLIERPAPPVKAIGAADVWGREAHLLIAAARARRRLISMSASNPVYCRPGTAPAAPRRTYSTIRVSRLIPIYAPTCLERLEMKLCLGCGA